jgi:hypothetical protein
MCVAPSTALAAVLLATRRMQCKRDWIRIGVPCARDADRVMRAAAVHVSRCTGTHVALRFGGFQCEIGTGHAVQRWLLEHAAEVVHSSLPRSAAEALLACDEGGRLQPGRWCAALIKGKVVYFSQKRHRAGGVHHSAVPCRSVADVAAMVGAIARTRRLGPAARARASRLVLQANKTQATPSYTICLPKYATVEERLATTA